MEASLKEHCLDLRTFWFKPMTCKHHAPYLNYVDDSTVFDVCNNTTVPMLQESADVITDWSRTIKGMLTDNTRNATIKGGPNRSV